MLAAETSPVLYAALATGVTGIILGIINKWPVRKPGPRYAETVDARAQWLVDQLQEQLTRAEAAGEACRTERDGLRSELAELRAEVKRLEAEVADLTSSSNAAGGTPHPPAKTAGTPRRSPSVRDGPTL